METPSRQKGNTVENEGHTKVSYTLEMLDPADLRPKLVDQPDFRVECMSIKCPEFNKFLHMLVGHDHRWGGRSHWTKNDWYQYVMRDGFETWVAYQAGTPVGYFELEVGTKGDVRIACFGLLPLFVGKGLGGHLLSKAVERAWELHATRVWLSTCSHDHPHALPNYLARGFRIVQTKEGPGNPPIDEFWETVTGQAGEL